LSSPLLKLQKLIHDRIVHFLDVQSAQALSETCYYFKELIQTRNLCSIPYRRKKKSIYKLNKLDKKCLYVYLHYSRTWEKRIITVKYGRIILKYINNDTNDFKLEKNEFFDYYKKEITNIRFIEGNELRRILEYYDIKRFLAVNGLNNVLQIEWDDTIKQHFTYNFQYIDTGIEADQIYYQSYSIPLGQRKPNSMNFTSISYQTFIRKAKEFRNENFYFITPSNRVWQKHNGCWRPKNILCECAENREFKRSYLDFLNNPNSTSQPGYFVKRSNFFYNGCEYFACREQKALAGLLNYKPRFLAFVDFTRIDYHCILSFCQYYLGYYPDKLFFGGKNMNSLALSYKFDYQFNDMLVARPGKYPQLKKHLVTLGCDELPGEYECDVRVGLRDWPMLEASESEIESTSDEDEINI
jgi:hypothetical protein